MADGAERFFPRITITGGVPGLPLSFVVAGDMANNFSEGYAVNITAKDRVATADRPGQSPHPPNMNYDSGAFKNVKFTVQLFSGCLINGSPKYSGIELAQTAETLFKLAMPVPAGASFDGPPLLTVAYGAFWRARGLFQDAQLISQGGWDEDHYPTLLTIEMEFARHFGAGGQTGGGAYKSAGYTELAKATAQQFAFKG